MTFALVSASLHVQDNWNCDGFSVNSEPMSHRAIIAVNEATFFASTL